MFHLLLLISKCVWLNFHNSNKFFHTPYFQYIETFQHFRKWSFSRNKQFSKVKSNKKWTEALVVNLIKNSKYHELFNASMNYVRINSDHQISTCHVLSRCILHSQFYCKSFLHYKTSQIIWTIRFEWRKCCRLIYRQYCKNNQMLFSLSFQTRSWT